MASDPYQQEEKSRVPHPNQRLMDRRIKLDFSETFEVLVGRGERSRNFVLHELMFVSRSPFFEAATSARWRSASTGPVTLPDDGPDVFAAYSQVAYSGRLAYIHEEPETWDEAKTDEAFAHVIKAYILADKLGDLMTANMIIEELIALIEVTKLLPSPRVEKLVYDRTPESSQLRRLLVSYLVHEVDLETYLTIDRLASMPPELVRDVMLGFSELGKMQAVAMVDSVFHQLVRERPRCYFHQHDERNPPCLPPGELDWAFDL